jgi:hypothetical protein
MTRMTMRESARTPRLWLFTGAIWLVAAAAGLAMMAVYANRPGAPAHAPAEWPVRSRLARRAGAPTLVMLAHPRCDCTRASLAELAELMARVRPAPQAYVVFVKPRRVTEDWEHTDLWKLAAGIAGVAPVLDEGGVEADRFGAQTSGQALLYDRDGHLAFEGGATSARGHVGENVGFDALAALLGGRRPDRTRTPVYGCSLFSAQDSAPDATVKRDAI